MPTLLSSAGAAVGVSAAEIVNIARANVRAGTAWTADGCVMLTYAISNLAGLPFFNLANYTINNNPLSVQDRSLSVPHSGSSNLAGDGWLLAWSGASAASLRNNVQAGDIVRVYHAGNSHEHWGLGDWAGTGSHYGAHSFIVESVSNGVVTVIDNWQGAVRSHSLDDIISYYAPRGSFQNAYVSRVDTAWVAANVGSGISGNGYGNFSSIGNTPPPPSDNAGNSISTASAISLGATLSGQVGSGADTDDYFRFTASANGTVSARLTGMSADLDLRAYSASNSQVTSSTNGGTTTDQISFSVSAGQTYYIRVDPYSSATSSYSLATSFAPSTPSSSNRPDLVIQNARIDDRTVRPGQEVRLDWDARNIGQGEAQGTDTFIFLSRDRNLTSGDRYLDRESLGTMSAGELDREFESFLIPTGLSRGTYYLAIVTDAGLDVTEINEANNITWVPFEII